MKYKAKILIVDDAEVVRLSHLRCLAQANFQVEAVRDGYEALSIMELRKYDVVFLDLRMPGMDGISVLRNIKNEWPDTEVVIITGYPTIETAKEAVRLGAFNYLVKPKAANDALTHKGWALRTNGPVRSSVQDLESRSWLNELPVHTARQGGSS
jgi:DNA-binding NtrC family response regulator